MNQYAIPDRVAIYAATYDAARRYLSANQPAVEALDLQPVFVAAGGHPGSVVGMRVASVIEVPGVRDHPRYQSMRDLLKRCELAHQRQNGVK